MPRAENFKPIPKSNSKGSNLKNTNVQSNNKKEVFDDSNNRASRRAKVKQEKKRK